MPALRPEFDKYRAFIFDIDDTLIVTFDVMWKIYARAALLQGYSYADDREFIRGIWGAPMSVAFPPAFPGVDLERAMQDFLRLVEEVEAEPRAGASEVMAALAARGARMGAVTAGEHKRIHSNLAQAGLYDYLAGNVYGADNLAHFKPDPRALDPLVTAWAAEGIELDEIAMIGDSLHDYRPALGRDVDFYAVVTGLTTEEAFLEAGLPPERIMRSLEEMLSE